MIPLSIYSPLLRFSTNTALLHTTIRIDLILCVIQAGRIDKGLMWIMAKQQYWR